MTGASVNQSEGASPTPSTLLERVKVKDQAAWERLVHIYTPLVYRWCRLAGLQEADAADVGQEVFRAVAQAIADFRHGGPADTFRGWLRTITLNKIRDFARRQRAEIPGVGGSAAQQHLLQVAEDSAAEDEHSAKREEQIVYRRAVEMILTDYEEPTRLAFWRVVVEGQAVADVAKDLGLSRNAIYLAKSRILRRLREEFAGILD